jgi:hypothetical protein
MTRSSRNLDSVGDLRATNLGFTSVLPFEDMPSTLHSSARFRSALSSTAPHSAFDMSLSVSPMTPPGVCRWKVASSTLKQLSVFITSGIVYSEMRAALSNPHTQARYAMRSLTPLASQLLLRHRFSLMSSRGLLHTGSLTVPSAPASGFRRQACLAGATVGWSKKFVGSRARAKASFTPAVGSVAYLHHKPSW